MSFKSGKIKAQKIIMSIILSFAYSMSYADEDKPKYLTDYQAYNEAIKQGDKENAIKYARSAWKDAETTLGDDERTMILAYNYAYVILENDYEAALPAITRVKYLLDAGYEADIPRNDLLLYSEYAQFRSSEQRRKEANRFRQFLKSVDGLTPDGDRILFQSWFHLMISDHNRKKYKQAEESAKRSLEALEVVAPNDYETKAFIMMIQGISIIVPTPRNYKDVNKSHDLFVKAQLLFPPQKNIDEFNKVFAQLMAWGRAAYAALTNISGKDFKSEIPEEEQQKLTYFEERALSNEDCGIVWAEREPPEFPEEASGQLGAVIIGYDFDQSLEPQNIRLLAEVPAEKFGSAALNAVQKWRLESQPKNEYMCRYNQLVFFTFTAPRY